MLTDRFADGTRTPPPAETGWPESGQLKDMVMISDRPAEIEDRAVPGHGEGDFIVGSTSTRSAIGTLVWRTSKFPMLLHLPGNHTALTVSTAMTDAMNTLLEQLRRSVTWDQGGRWPSTRRSRWRPGCRSTT